MLSNQQKGTFMTKNLDDFLNDIGYRESSGRADIINEAGYLGLYQMGIPALIDAGYYDIAGNNNNNQWETRYFTGKDGINNIDDFLKSPEKQKKAMIAYKKKQWGYLKNWGVEKYIGKTINGIKITSSGLLAGAHLVGQERLEKYLASNGKYIPKDGNKTSVEEYLSKFANYDVSEITGISPQENEDEYSFILNGYANKNDFSQYPSYVKNIMKQLFPLQSKMIGNIYDGLIKKYNTSKQTENGHWVTIDGNHVFIEDK